MPPPLALSLWINGGKDYGHYVLMMFCSAPMLFSYMKTADYRHLDELLVLLLKIKLNKMRGCLI